jgi:sirohydrochlorin cobaltochelatase
MLLLKTKPVLILLGHGSKARKTREEMEDLAARLQESSPDLGIASAFLTLLEPSLEQAVASAARAGAVEIHVLPLFFFSGKHVLEDIPTRIEALRARHPDLDLSLREPVGRHPAFFDLLRQAGGFA